MDSNNGGTGIGYADTLSKALAFTQKNADVLVSGHSKTTSTNADLKNYIQFFSGYVREVQAAKKARQDRRRRREQLEAAGWIHGPARAHPLERADGFQRNELKAGWIVGSWWSVVSH